MGSPKSQSAVIRTPDYRLRVFVSSTLKELAAERKAVREAILRFRLAPVMFESGARPHPAQSLYRAYLTQSHIFIGIYWQSYGWVGPGMTVSGLEDEYVLSKDLPCLIYVKNPAPDREPALRALLEKIRDRNASAYKSFSTPEELGELVESDLALLLSEHFEAVHPGPPAAGEGGEPALSNVPIPRNPLIGREQELTWGSSLLLRDDVALVTLTGPAGTGKSRLGIQLALDLRDHFRDGTFLVSLESIRDPDLVIPRLAATLGLSETPGGPPLAQLLKEHLRDKEMLLLLDNFEQVLPAAPRISELLELCPRLKILVTSRAPLHLRAERELHVPPLAVPPPTARREPESLSHYPAAQLFIQRAQSIKPDFQVTSENAAAVTEILYRLDGLPLAIELASARIRMLSPEALLPRLEHRFDLLRGGTRDLPERQRTLYEAIEWSYSLLKDDDKRLLRRLSVFSDGWDIEAAERVCGGEGEQEIFDGLEGLIDNNLVVSPEQVEGDLRLRMLGTIREFGYGRLKESDEASTIPERHARHFLTLAQQADAELDQPSQQIWLKRLELELGNLRAARSWALERDNTEYILQLCAALGQFWELHGYYREGRTWAEEALARSAGAPADLRAKALKVAGRLAYQQRHLPAAQRFLEESLALFQELGYTSEAASALNNLGRVAWSQENLERASELYNQALDLRREQNDQQGIANVLTNLGLVAMRVHQFERAAQYMQESVDLFRGLGNKAALANGLFDLGLVEVRMEDGCARAGAHFAESVELSRELGYRKIMAYALDNLALLALSEGEVERAITQAQESLELCRMQEDTLGALYALIVVGHGLLDRGDAAAAARMLVEALSLLEELQASSGQVWREELAWLLQGAVHLLVGRDQAAPAVHLAGAAATVGKEADVHFPPCAAAYFQAILTQAQAKLGEQASAEAWAAGQALGTEQAAEEVARILQPQA